MIDEQQAARAAALEEAAALIDAKATALEVPATHTGMTLGRVFREFSADIRALRTTPPPPAAAPDVLTAARNLDAALSALWPRGLALGDVGPTWRALQSALLTAPPVAAKAGEITQEHARKMRDALDFYACIDHYPGHTHAAPEAVRTDRGEKARAALAGVPR